MKWKLLAIVCILGLSALTDSAWTCSCAPPPPPKQALAQAAAVFSAKVVKIEDVDGTTLRRITLKVDKWWKGGDAATIDVVTQKSGATCGFGFQPDTSYLVYAGADKKGRKDLVVSLCSRTRTLAQADQSGDMKELGEGKAPVK